MLAPLALPPAGRVTLAQAPEGLDALALARLVLDSPGGLCLHIARDDARTARIEDLLGFFAPGLEVLLFPAWDCLPYDRVSPRPDILAARLAVLSRLIERRSEREPAPCVVLTTVNAASQRVVPEDLFTERLLSLKCHAEMTPARVTGFLTANGYHRTATVREPGEFAVRGGIVDLFPPSVTEPLRLDFFGDELESIRGFDPTTQRSTGSLETVALKPVNEVLLTEDSISRFRGGYRAAFGVAKADPLYEAVSAGRPHPGMEHWLPLFYDELVTLFDYLPRVPITLDHQAEEVRQARAETIADFYAARRSLEGAAESGEWIYRPLPPERLYLDEETWQRSLAGHRGGDFSAFAVPEEGGEVLSLGGQSGLDFTEARKRADGQLYDLLRDSLKTEQAAGTRVLIGAFSAGARDRLAHVLAEHGLERLQPVTSWAEVEASPPGSLSLAVLQLDKGFRLPGLLIVTEQDILGERIARKSARQKRPDNFLTEVSALEAKDLVVHVDHGIGRYEGLETLTVSGAAHDCLKVVYHGGDKLFVPVENIEVLSRFGSEDATVDLDRLGGANWQQRKAKVKERLQAMAGELIKVAAARELKQVEVLNQPEGLYDEFAARFPYPETEDQQRAIEDCLAGLAKGRPMDRLVCGDVGFGKTEVALRAAFVTAMSGKQVAVVVPTTLLARQHNQTFRERFAGLPIKIRQLSRLVSARDQRLTREGLKDGTVDIVVGTHALLAKSIEFRDLGLLIVDEEQHFGVKQKERLKTLRADVHVLTLTATPIPRTLQLAMSGVKEMSLIASPPVDRLAVRTFVLPYDPVIVREAIMREHFRGGQTFYVCPRIQDLGELTERLAKLVPEVKVAVAHGQLPPADLERVMEDFYDRKFDLLLSTNIVESGLDIPSANTLILHRADMFGLAQLYQLRGRIGRSKTRGYAYLTLPPGRLLTAAALRRLEVMQTLDTLGAGFQLASHDMDIRGAGNLLGEEQSGHVREVGIELYQQMLEEAVANARAGGSAEAAPAAAEAFSPQIAIGSSVLIPEGYVSDLSVRLGLYRRLADLVDRQEIEAFAAELIDRFGPLPAEVENLLQVMAIKQLCRDAGVEKVEAGPKGAVVTFHKAQFARPEALIAFIQSAAGKVKLRPDHSLFYGRKWELAEQRLKGVHNLLRELVELAA